MTCIATLCYMLGMLSVSSAQFFPPASDAQTAQSSFSKDVSVSFKETTGLCETTPKVKSYSGYISTNGSLPQIGGLPGYPINTFYWFFESRKEPSTAPFVLWHGGGPGFPGSASAVYENGPCTINDDSNSTTLNPYSWNNEANIIYIDSPSMVGYSYDVLTNATIDGLNSSLPIIPAHFGDVVPQANTTFQVGTFGSQNPLNTANSTGTSSPLVWASLQAWFSVFPQYTPQGGHINLWSESYGGRFMPDIANYITRQNEAIASGALQNAMTLTVDTIGLNNAYIDPLTHAKSYPAFVNNNTYGIQTVPPAVQASMQQNLTKQGGCLDAMSGCQALVALYDPADNAQNTTVDQLCGEAFLLCEINVQKAYDAVSNRGQDDIAHPAQDPFPPESFVGFFNQHWVQAALGAVVNYTSNSATVLDAFVGTGDLARQGALAQLGGLLDAGTVVSLFSGDRDYEVNWFGGEAVSLAMNYSQTAAFGAAGYANMTSSNGSWGGVTRQAGNFSFTRVFQAGHSVPAYQPRVALDVFTRVLSGKDVATGQTAVTNNYTTRGPASSFAIKNAVPLMPEPVCYTWEIGLTCAPNQQLALANGEAVVKNFLVISPGPNTTTTAAKASEDSTTAAAAQTSTMTSDAVKGRMAWGGRVMAKCLAGMLLIGLHL